MSPIKCPVFSPIFSDPFSINFSVALVASFLAVLSVGFLPIFFTSNIPSPWMIYSPVSGFLSLLLHLYIISYIILLSSQPSKIYLYHSDQPYGLRRLSRKRFYYINTNEIPGELSGENMISSHVKITCYFHMWKYHRCYGYIINHTFRRIKLFQWNGLVFHWCLYSK